MDTVWDSRPVQAVSSPNSLSILETLHLTFVFMPP